MPKFRSRWFPKSWSGFKDLVAEEGGGCVHLYLYFCICINLSLYLVVFSLICVAFDILVWGSTFGLKLNPELGVSLSRDRLSPLLSLFQPFLPYRPAQHTLPFSIQHSKWIWIFNRKWVYMVKFLKNTRMSQTVLQGMFPLALPWIWSFIFVFCFFFADLLAPQSIAHSIGAFRDPIPSNRSTFSLWSFEPVYTEAFKRSKAFYGDLWQSVALLDH